MAKTYKVGEVQERTTIDRQGQVQKVYRVTAASHTGTTFTVDIPEADFKPDKVARILEEKASLIESVKSL